MPLALDVNETYPVSLRSDDAKPEAERPTFEFRFMSHGSARLARKLLADWEAHQALDIGPGGWTRERRDELLEQIFASLRSRVAGWRNLPRNFSPAVLDEMLTDGEGVELMYRAMRNSRPTPEEQNESGSPSQSGTPNSASEAAGPVKTSQM